MAISPPADGGSKFNMTAAMPFTPHPAAKRENHVASAESEAAAVEKESMRRVENAQNQVAEAERNASLQLDGIRDEYVRSSGAEATRTETSVESQRIKGYEQIRELQRAQQLELSRVKREGDLQLATAQNYYRDATYGAEQRGKEELSGIEHNSAQNMDYQQKNADFDAENLRQQNTQRLKGMMDESDHNYAALSADSHVKYDQAKTTSEQAQDQTNQKFLAQYENTVAHQTDTIQNLETKASQRVRDVRVDTSRKLAAYNERQKDPFYQMMDIGARITETPEAYVLRATIPDHERQHLAVAIRGNQVVVSGQRHNEEKLEVTPGHNQSTNAFQTYSESFPLNWPVDARKVSRAFEGDELVVTIPKKGVYAAQPVYQGKHAERAQVERPKFPENLPHTGPEAKPDPDAPPPAGPSERSTGGRTLG